jgi:hypothetical protein
MIRIEGAPVAAERLQKALGLACQAGPRHGVTTTAMSARDEAGGVNIDAGTSIPISSDRPRCFHGQPAPEWTHNAAAS